MNLLRWWHDLRDAHYPVLVGHPADPDAYYACPCGLTSMELEAASRQGDTR